MLIKVLRSTLALTLIVCMCNLAAAQYPGGGGGGGGGGMPGSPTYNSNRSYSNKGAIIGGIVGGAALVGGLLYWRHHHNQTKLQGCVRGNGDKIVNEKDNQTYALTNAQTDSLKSGERVELLGKMSRDDTGEPTFEVHKMAKDLGVCTAPTAGGDR